MAPKWVARGSFGPAENCLTFGFLVADFYKVQHLSQIPQGVDMRQQRFNLRTKLKTVGLLPPAETASVPTLICRICGKPLAIESAKTDAEGKAVHEACYVGRLTEQSR